MSIRQYKENYERPFKCIIRRDILTGQRHVELVVTDTTDAKKKQSIYAHDAKQLTMYELISVATVNELISVGILIDEAQALGKQYGIPQEE